MTGHENRDRGSLILPASGGIASRSTTLVRRGLNLSRQHRRLDDPSIARLRNRAEAGDPEAQFDLGQWYHDRDNAEAVRWLRKAAEQGHAGAQSSLGNAFSWWDGTNSLAGGSSTNVGEDDAQAALWYRKAAEQGDSWAQENLGEFYAEGRGVDQDDAQAVLWYRKAAEQGSSGAQLSLGIAYAHGRGVPPDRVEAYKWISLGFLHNVLIRYDASLLAADLDALVRYPFALRLANFVALGASASAGDLDVVAAAMSSAEIAEAQQRAREWAERRAVAQGQAGAQYSLGWMYAHGHGVPQDDTEAISWFRRAAQQGHQHSQYWLGWMYAHGRGIPQDDTEAIKWFRLAAEAGDRDARYTLGLMYADGRGVPQDYVAALMHLEIAGYRGSDEYNKLMAAMTEEQVSEAGRRAREWRTELENG